MVFKTVREDVRGVLTAMSMHLKNGAIQGLLEIQNEHHILHIILEKSGVLPGSLEIGKVYHFNHLKLWRSFPQGMPFDLWVLDPGGVCTEEELLLIPEVEFDKNLINYCGVVTDLQISSSLYTLDNRVNMCVAFIDGMFTLPCLLPGYQITVYNAHKITKNDVPCLILCGKSLIEINNKSHVNNWSSNPSKTSLVVQSLGFGFRGYQSLLNLSSVLQSKFPDKFLHSLDINDTEQFHSEVLVEVATLITLGCKTAKFEDIAAEFVSKPHRCILAQEGEININIVSLQDILFCAQGHASSASVVGGWGQLVFTQDVVGMILVGIMDVSPVTGQWILRDTSADIKCVISNLNSLMPDISAGRKLVMLKHYCIVLERIESYSEGGKLPTTNIYLHILAKNIKVLNVVLNGHSVRKADETPRDKKRKSVDISLSVSSASQSTPSRQRMISVNGILLQKSTFLKKDNISICALLVRFLGDISELAGPTRSIILCASTSEHLRQVAILQPCCHLQLVYSARLRLKKSTWRLLVKDTANYPIVWLPKESQLVQSNVLLVPTLLQQQGVCSVREVMKLPHCEIIDVEGQLIDRFHRYQSQKHHCIEDDNFGLPAGVQSVVLKLKDSTADDMIILYITEWNNHVYPLGVVVGAYVLVTSVKIIISRTRGTRYLCTTAFSRIEVIDLDPSLVTSSLDIPILCPEKQRSASVSLQSRIFSCSSLIYLKFSPHPTKYKVTVKAWCIYQLEDMKMLMLFTNEQVQQLLQIPPTIWKGLLSLAEKYNGLLYRRERSIFPKNKKKRTVENALLLYVESVDWKHIWNIEFWINELSSDKQIKAYATKLLKIC